jgi:trimethylamine--corrinoid protein Co-methyltransferase
MPRECFAGGQLELLTTEEVETIHASSLRILEEIGVKVPLAEALDIYTAGGALVDRDSAVVRIPASLVEQVLSRAPSEILLCGRDEANDLQLAGKNVFAGTGGAEVKVLDLDTGQLRQAVLKDVADIARLVDALEHIDYYIRPVEAQDVPLQKLDLNKYYAALCNTTKHVMGNVYFREKVAEVIELAAVLTGGVQELIKRPIVSFITSWMLGTLTANPEVTANLIEIASRGMPVALSSVSILGLTSPVTMAGNLALTHAEQMAGIALCQLVNPGTPVIYGGCPGVIDIRSMAFCPGSIERSILNTAISQFSRRIGVPNYNFAGGTDAKIPDIQTGYEKAFGICMAALAGSNYIHHAAGRIKDGVAYEQYVIDNEIIGMAKRALKGIRVTEDTLALEAIRSVKHGGSFIDHEHTLEHYRDEFFFPRIADRKSWDKWESSGSLDARERARREARRILQNHRPQPIPESCDAQIRKRFEIVF